MKNKETCSDDSTTSRAAVGFSELCDRSKSGNSKEYAENMNNLSTVLTSGLALKQRAW
jgi:hypothetical protein